MTGVQTCALPICFPVTILYGGKVFGSDETAGVLLSESGEIFEVNTTSKFDLANQILDKVSTRFRLTSINSEVINER